MTLDEQAAVAKVLQTAADYGADLCIEKQVTHWEADIWWEDDQDEDDPSIAATTIEGGDVGTGPTPLAAIVDLARRL